MRCRRWLKILPAFCPARSSVVFKLMIRQQVFQNVASASMLPADAPPLFRFCQERQCTQAMTAGSQDAVDAARNVAAREARSEHLDSGMRHRDVRAGTGCDRRVMRVCRRTKKGTGWSPFSLRDTAYSHVAALRQTDLSCGRSAGVSGLSAPDAAACPSRHPIPWHRPGARQSA